jgi:membrane-bound lytic murein transglycosylase F
MPGTAGDVGKALGHTPDQFWLPEVSIRAAGYYMGQLHRTWRAPRPAMDRMMLSMASYNAGAGHLIKAQRICGGGNLYRQVIPCLPQVTGHHSKETIDYVEKIIGRWWPRMLLE